ncbi:MAG: response regulator transcription factor [Bacillota bacterium]|nr:response regulator transcription factor [Bacillota bacterium]MDI3299539.1 response regulator transcription factor [Bacillota bacterium]
MKPIRVLLVDDHTILREGIRSLLEEQEDIEVVGEAGDGVEAVELTDRLLPDVVLMDIGLPRMNGVDATQAILRRHPEVRVLVLTMHDNEEYVRTIMQAGASGYVLKRSAARELVSAIRAVNEGHTVLNPQLSRAVFAGGGARGEAAGQPLLPRVQAPDVLTEREQEVLRLIARGYTNQEIADKLMISIKTVQAHRGNIMEKLDLHDAVELTKYAIRVGLISLDDSEEAE